MQRNLKVYYRTIFHKRKKAYTESTYEEVPSIVLSGKWLESAGFSVADNIKVSVETEKIIISKVN